jgi:hypothetical protein
MNEMKRALTKVATKTIKVIAPSIAVSIAKNKLFTPKKKGNKWPKHVTQFYTDTRLGKVKTYKYGEGKCIWLIHGWSGSAYDFWPLMQKLSERGYSTITFDFPSHGNCTLPPKPYTLPQLIKVFDDVSSSLFEPALVITHGIGISVVANSYWIKSYNRGLLLTSPIFDIYKLMQKLVSKSGFDQELFDRVIHEIYKRDKMLLPRLSAIPQLQKFKGEVKIVHDKDDVTAPFIESERLIKTSNATLIETNKRGHNGVLKSRNILNTIDTYNVFNFESAASWHDVYQ